MPAIRDLPIDRSYALDLLIRLLAMPSPAGLTDDIVHMMGAELDRLGIPFEVTRRGAIRATIAGRRSSPDRAVIAHLDTLGAMVKGLKPNGRLTIVPIGYWSARFAEGARVTIFSDNGITHRGTVLPLKASGHTFSSEVDSQPSAWENLEVRIDARIHSIEDLLAAGINVGDHIAIDTHAEVAPNGFVVSRHTDDKAGVAAILAAARAVHESAAELPVDVHLLLTITEEVGAGASHILHGDVAELVAVDNSTIAEGQNSSAYGVTVCMKDMSGPFDYHLTRRLLSLCREYSIDHSRDLYNYYRSDAASAQEAGNDVRTALISFACDGSHGWERTHMDSVCAVARLLALYMQSPPLFERDAHTLGSLAGFPAPSGMDREPLVDRSEPDGTEPPPRGD